MSLSEVGGGGYIEFMMIYKNSIRFTQINALLTTTVVSSPILLLCVIKIYKRMAGK